MTLTLRAAALASALFAAATTAHARDLPADVSAYLQDAVDAGAYAGVIVAIVDDGDVTVKSFGTADRSTGAAIDENTVFEIGSISKTVTGTLLAEEVQAGAMALDDSVQSLLPGGVTIKQIGERPMTLADLATHRSGLPRLPDNFAPKDPTDPYADYDRAKLWADLGSMTPARAPGASYEYSNLGAGLLGTLIAMKTGVSYDELVRTRIFEPLGMDGSDTRVSPGVSARLAQGYSADGNAVGPWAFKALAGAGAIKSSMHDMLLYLRANMAVAAGDAPDEPLYKAMALAHEPRIGIGAPDRPQIGLFWMSLPDKSVYFHDGGTYGFSSFLGFSGDGKHGVVLLANTLQSDITSAAGLHLLKPATPLPPVQKAVTLPADLLASYVGTYQATPQLAFTVTLNDGQLNVQLTGQGAAPVYASAKDQFFYKIVSAQISFDRDEDGAVYRLVLHQGGQRIRAARLDTDGKPLPQPQPLELDEAALDAYAGRYQIRPGLVIEVTREGGQLMVMAPGQKAPQPVFAEAPDHFQFGIADIDVIFERGASGKVVALTAGTGTQKSRAEKLPD